MRVLVHYEDELGTGVCTESFFSRVATETLARCPADLIDGKEEITLTAVAVSEERIRTLNASYRQKEAVTDILSFSEYVDTEAFRQDHERVIFLGELFLCQSYIARSAQEDSVTLEHEMAFVFSHGILHLLGYDHSEEMFAIQDQVTEQVMKKN